MLKRDKEAIMQVSPSFEVRNLRFEFSSDIPKFWQGGPKSVSLFLDNLSTFFPEGEKFFMRAVRRYQNQITDPQLKADIRSFHGQEAMHTREHQKYNAFLTRNGIDADQFEKEVKAILDRVEETLPDRWKLAATAALEHFTALLAEILLDDRGLMKDAHPELRDLWYWHAAEENEHKNVAYDVYYKVGGNYPERVLVMLLATVVFWTKLADQQARMMHKEGLLFSAKEWKEFIFYMFINPAPLSKLILPYLRYFKPGFHPSQSTKATRLVERWKAEQAAG